MAFCTNCGSPVEGAFCTKCGTRVGNAGGFDSPSPQAPPVTPPAVNLSAPSQAPKKGRAVFWILGGCLGLIAIGSILFFAAGTYIFHKIGFDRGLLEKKPELAVAKMIVSANPDLEVLSIDEDRGIIKVRDKKSGKALTVNLEDAKNGKISFTDDQNNKVEIKSQGEGENATMEIQSNKGSMRMGANASIQLPRWLPSYPGAVAAGGVAFDEENGRSGSCSLKTNAPVDSVAAFYDNALKNAGFEVQKSPTQSSGPGAAIVISATDSSSQRKADVTATPAEDGTIIHLIFEDK